MHHAIRSSLTLALLLTVLSLGACETQDRRIYSTHKDKNLHTPSPFAPSTSKAADEATSPLAMPPGPPDADSSAPPAEAPAQ